MLAKRRRAIAFRKGGIKTRQYKVVISLFHRKKLLTSLLQRNVTKEDIGRRKTEEGLIEERKTLLRG